MGKVTIRDIDVRDKKVLLRADFNVPMKDGVITDDNRIKEEIPTINYLLEKGAAVIVCSHLGRPEGKVDKKYSLAPVSVRLAELLGRPVIMADDVIGKDATKKAKELKSGEVLLIENVRFHAEEEENEPKFAEKLAKLADVYVNDAFGTAHRKHATTYGVAKLLPNAIGFLIEKELQNISENIANPAHPFVAILGGAKVSDKIGIVTSFINSGCDNIIIGGAMAYTFLKSMGYKVGKSLVEKDYLKEVKGMLALAEEKGVKVAIENCPMLFGRDQWPGGQNLMCTPVMYRKLFEIIPSKNFGLNFDPSHYVWQGLDYLKTVYEFKDRIFHIHFKDIKLYPEKLADCGVLAYPLDYMSPKIPGLGDVNWGAFVSALNDIRYDGDAVIEVEDKAFENCADDVRAGIEQSYRFMKQYM